MVYIHCFCCIVLHYCLVSLFFKDFILFNFQINPNTPIVLLIHSSSDDYSFVHVIAVYVSIRFFSLPSPTIVWHPIIFIRLLISSVIVSLTTDLCDSYMILLVSSDLCDSSMIIPASSDLCDFHDSPCIFWSLWLFHDCLGNVCSSTTSFFSFSLISKLKVWQNESKTRAKRAASSFCAHHSRSTDQRKTWFKYTVVISYSNVCLSSLWKRFLCLCDLGFLHMWIVQD